MQNSLLQFAIELLGLGQLPSSIFESEAEVFVFLSQGVLLSLHVCEWLAVRAETTPPHPNTSSQQHVN